MSAGARSRYHLALLLESAGAGIFACGGLLFAILPDKLIGMVTVPIGIGLMSAAYAIRCVKCRKSIMAEYFLGQPGMRRVFGFRNRFLPERICSNCGTSFDTQRKAAK